jgi:hypothetical protein
LNSPSSHAHLINSPHSGKQYPHSYKAFQNIQNSSNTPTPTSGVGNKFSSPLDRETFEAALSDAERGVLEDYDLQLALALSLSIDQQQQQQEAQLPDVEAGLIAGGVKSPVGRMQSDLSQKQDEDDEDDEIPLSRKRDRVLNAGSASPIVVVDLLSGDNDGGNTNRDDIETK